MNFLELTGLCFIVITLADISKYCFYSLLDRKKKNKIKDKKDNDIV